MLGPLSIMVPVFPEPLETWGRGFEDEPPHPKKAGSIGVACFLGEGEASVHMEERRTPPKGVGQKKNPTPSARGVGGAAFAQLIRRANFQADNGFGLSAAGLL